jgi:hypothetical protein
VRLGILVLVLALASGGATVRAQSKQLGNLSFTNAPHVPSLRTYDFGKTPFPQERDDPFGLGRQAASTTWYADRLGPTCPMPVFRSEGANDDPMPVARGGPTEPMPVARSGCWNPLDPQD